MTFVDFYFQIKTKIMKTDVLKYCYDLDDAWGQEIALYQFLPRAFAIVHIVYTAVEGPIKLWIFHLASVFVWYVARILQDLLGQLRPYPFCLSHEYSVYGLPCPKQVWIISTCTNELMYQYYYNPNGISKRRLVKTLIIMFFIPTIYVYAYVSSPFQALLSFLYAVFMTILSSSLVYRIQLRYETPIERVYFKCLTYLDVWKKYKLFKTQ